MKRDMDLCRKILLAAEEQTSVPDGFLEIDGYAQELVAYNVELLADEGLVEASVIKSQSEPIGAVVLRLTWAGHDFLDAARNETVWNRVKGRLSNAGVSATFDLLKTLLVEGTKALLNSK